MIPLPCVLECSSIGAMILLGVIVVATRIGVNKHHLSRDATGAAKGPAPAGPTPIVILLMILVGIVISVVVSPIVWALSPVQ